MRRFLKPLGTFFKLQFGALLIWLLFPALGDRLALLLFHVPGANLWGWTWAVSSARLLIIVLMELLILWRVGMEVLRGDSV